MITVQRKFVDWKKTGRNLEMLRNDNINLRRASCRSRNFNKSNCEGDCENCTFEMDRSISRGELALLFGTTEHVVYNWENGKTAVPYEDLLFYSQISETALEDFVVYME